MYKKGRGELDEEMRETEERGMEDFSILDSSEKKTIVVLGDRWWPQKKRNRKGIR